MCCCCAHLQHNNICLYILTFSIYYIYIRIMIYVRGDMFLTCFQLENLEHFRRSALPNQILCSVIKTIVLLLYIIMLLMLVLCCVHCYIISSTIYFPFICLYMYLVLLFIYARGIYPDRKISYMF